MSEEYLGKDDLSQISFHDAKIVIKIEGSGLDGQIDANIASLIIKIQNEIFNIAKIVEFGEEASTRRLPKDLQNALLVQFKVERGCTEVLAEILGALSTIFSIWGEKMTPEQLLDIAKTIAFLLAGGVVSVKAINVLKELLLKYLENKHLRQMSQQSNQHAEEIADKIIESARLASDKIVESTAKTFRTANGLKYGPRTFNQQQLEELRGRSPRSKLHDTQTNQRFLIKKLNGEKRPTIYVELQEFPSGETLKATYSQPEESLFDEIDGDDESEDYVVLQMSLAFSANQPIELSVVYSRNEAGEIVRVVILGTV